MNSHLLKRIVIAVLTASLLCVWVRPGEACGPFFLESIFTYSVHPDMPLDGFVQGRLGVVQPTYARSYLYAAYRQMMGASFDQAEQKALLQLWKERLELGSSSLSEEDLTKPWIDARATVADVPTGPKIDLYRSREKPNEYESYLNCQGDAFATAASTLAERQKRFGAATAELKDWVLAQDAVFSNCAQGQNIPSELPAGSPEWLQMDRQYQIAAAHFYAAHFADARDRFAAIARDNSSPWQQTAEYMVARTSLRQASLGKEEDKLRSLAEAETKLKQILTEKRLSSQHHASQRLLNLVRLRFHPEEKLHELAKAVLQKGAGESLKQDVWDYTVLLDKFVGEDGDESAQPRELPAALTSEDMTDWIVTFESESPASLTHSLARFQKTNSLPWLLAALAKVDAKHPQAASLLAAAAKVERRSPAFSSIAFHRVRLLQDRGDPEGARSILDGILAGERTWLAPSAVNRFLGQRMILASSLSDFLRHAPRRPAGFSYDDDGRELPAEADEVGPQKPEESLLFDQDAVTAFNEDLPLTLQLQAAEANVLPEHLRREVTQAAWLRAALLDRRAEASQLASLLAGYYPELKELLAAYQRETTPDARRFSAAYIALKFPGLRPTVTKGLGRSGPLSEVDSYRDNWWCLAGSPIPVAADETPPGQKPKSPPRPVPFFLAQSDSASAGKEVAALNALGPAPNYLSRTAIDWANRKPADARAPEALHLAVAATRRGCTDKETGRWSKAAFDLLHRRYPNNVWARKTKYWFKD